MNTKKNFFSIMLWVLFFMPIFSQNTDKLINTTSNDYAIIINTGKRPRDNMDYYWNDCSIVYKTLVQNGYDRSHICVLMSDGKSSQADMKLSNGTFRDSSKDLDGDGTDDINFSSTKDTLQMVFNKFSRELTQYDNVFIYVTGPADIGGTLRLWGNDTIQSGGFVNEIHKLQNVKTVNLVMQTCYSGGYVEDLRHQHNCVVSTACAYDEKAWITTWQFG